jgi:hypothetical protein
VTPILHAVGELDSTVPPGQTGSLARQCSFPWLYEFFGGHYVPQHKESLSFSQSLGRFLSEVLGLSEMDQDAWEDIDIVDAKTKAQRTILGTVRMSSQK